MNKKLELFAQITKVSSIALRRLSSHGLSFSDIIILSLLDNAKDGKLKRIDLANLMGLSASGVTRMILPLEKLGIIEREDSESDARARYSKLTKTGKELYQDAINSINFKVEDLLPNIEEKELDSIIKILDEVKNG